MLPVGTHGRTTLVATMVLETQTTIGLTSRGQATELTVLVDWVADPANARIATDSFVGDIDHDDLEVFEGSILVEPVRVEHSQVASFACCSLLSDTTQGAPGLQVVDACIARLAIHLTLVHWTLASSTTDADTVEQNPCLALYPRRRALSGRVGRVARCTVGI